jgi:mannose-1-phosphate guanylyltransferase/mannose-6-phosphate isomerase
MSEPNHSSEGAFSAEKITPLILCGGSGSRLWPVSTKLAPKQLLSLTGSETLLQRTVRRVCDQLFNPAIIVTGRSFEKIVAEQLAAIGARVDKILLEPAARNTAAALGVAAFFELQGQRDPLILAMPADHLIVDETPFKNAARLGAQAANSGRIVTFGIRPRYAETGYGYIETAPGKGGSGISGVLRFTEKPDPATAAKYVQSGRHFWNAGIFLFRASTLVAELREHAPSIAAACEQAAQDADASGSCIRIGEAFNSSPSISFDYAVLEKSDRISMVEADIGWSDIGSWDALWEIGEKDAEGNVTFGNVLLVDSRGCLVRNELEGPLAVIDSTDLVIVVTALGSLVVPRQASQKTKLVADFLKTSG